MNRVRTLLQTVALCLTLAATARAQSAPLELEGSAIHERSIGLYAAADYLGSAGASGSAISFGLRARLYRHLAASLDLGYGLLNESNLAEDRWWAIPAVAFVIPAGPVSFDLGGGVGVGTVSGYDSWSAYFAKPFTPIWHFTTPAVSAHAIMSAPITRQVDLFARAEVATLFASSATAHDAVWVGLSIGLRARVL